MLEHLISHTGESTGVTAQFDLALFKQLNAEYETKPVVPAPREHTASYTSQIGRKRCEMLQRKIGIKNLRVLELGCGDGMLSRAMARDHGCEVVGVDIQGYDDWAAPAEGDLSQFVHDVSAGDNAALGQFDRVVSFAVFEHIVHPHAALKATFDLLKPGGKAYIFANLYRGAKASHRYRDVFFPWPHLLFEASVWREFYVERLGEPLQAAWVNKLTYDQYLGMAKRIGFEIKKHFASAPYFDEAFYKRFEYQLAAYPKFDLMHDFVHLVLEKPLGSHERLSREDCKELLNYPLRQGALVEAHRKGFWDLVPAKAPDWRSENPNLENLVLAVRQALASRPVKPYDLVSYVEDNNFDAANVLVNNSIEIFGFTFQFNDNDLIDTDGSSRTKQLFAHSWDHIEPILREYGTSNDKSLLNFAFKVANDWIDKYGEIALSSSVPSPERSESFILYDTAIGNRFHRLAYLVCATAADKTISDAIFARMLMTMLNHARALITEETFSPQHNHGILQALAQICGSSRFLEVEKQAPMLRTLLQMTEVFEQGKKRLFDLLPEQFGADGVHKEHSPSYHTMLSRTINYLTNAGIIQNDLLSDFHLKTSYASSWMFDDQGRIAALGDTDSIVSAPISTMLPGTSSQKLFPEAGYWFVKGRSSEGSTYLAQSCAFHSRFHKQADSGTIIWHDRGTDILVDAGRYAYAGRTEPGSPLFMDGFWYADPKRVYVESTRAHNTVEIDGRNHRRYRQPPTGGTITGSIEQDGIFASRCVVPNAGPGQHRRFVVTKPGEWLAIFDTCRFNDGPHTVRQWFQIHPDWVVEQQGGKLRLDQLGQILSVVAPGCEVSEPVSGEVHAPRGDLDPGYLGWWSPVAGAFVPCSTFSVSKTAEFVTLSTLFTFGDLSEKDFRCIHNVTHRTIKLTWNDPNKSHQLLLTSQGLALDEFGLKYTVG